MSRVTPPQRKHPPVPFALPPPQTDMRGGHSRPACRGHEQRRGPGDALFAPGVRAHVKRSGRARPNPQFHLRGSTQTSLPLQQPSTGRPGVPYKHVRGPSHRSAPVFFPAHMNIWHRRKHALTFEDKPSFPVSIFFMNGAR